MKIQSLREDDRSLINAMMSYWPMNHIVNSTSTAPTFSSTPGTRDYSGTAGNGGAKPANGFGSFTGFQPRSVATNSQPSGTHSSVVSAAPAPPAGYSTPQTAYENPAYQATRRETSE